MAACVAALDPMNADAYAPAREKLDSIISHLQTVDRMTHSELDQFLDTDGREILRRLYQGYLDQCGPGAVTEPVVDANGQEHTHQRLHSRSLTTIFGEVTLDRQGYGGRGLKSLHRGHSSLVAAGMRRSATLRGLSDLECAPIDDCADYLLKYREFLHYDLMSGHFYKT